MLDGGLIFVPTDRQGVEENQDFWFHVSQTGSPTETADARISVEWPLTHMEPRPPDYYFRSLTSQVAVPAFNSLLAEPAPAGSTTVRLVSTAMLNVNGWLALDPAAPTREVRQVRAISGSQVTLGAPTSFEHPANSEARAAGEILGHTRPTSEVGAGTRSFLIKADAGARTGEASLMVEWRPSATPLPGGT